MKRILILMIAMKLVAPATVAQIATADVRVHDPVLAKHGDTYYLFATGRGIAVWSSPDLQQWSKERQVFDTPPAWTIEAVPTFKGHFWAPDISYQDGK